jgi:hypothetical protein
MGAVLQERVMLTRLAAPRLLLQKTQPGPAKIPRLRPRIASHLRGREAFPSHAGSASLHYFHRLQAHHVCLPTEERQMLTVAIQPPQFYVPVHDRHKTHLWTGEHRRWRPLLASSPSLHCHHTTNSPRRKTATSFEHSSGQQPPCGSRSNRFPAPRSPSTATQSAGNPRPYVPAPLRLRMFQSVHDLSHPGTKATARLVAQPLVWLGVQKDCRTWERTCKACQPSKASRHTVTPVEDFALPAGRFLHVHMDLVGPHPASAGYTYCLTAVDRFTHWQEAIRIPDSTADTVARTLLTGWTSRVGCPQTIHSDQGRQFESQLFRSLASAHHLILSLQHPS